MRLLIGQPRREAVEIAVTRIVTPPPGSFHRVPSRPYRRRGKLVLLGDRQTQQRIVACASLNIGGAHPRNKQFEIGQVRVRQKEVLPNRHACLWDLSSYVAIHKTGPNSPEQRKGIMWCHDNSMPLSVCSHGLATSRFGIAGCTVLSSIGRPGFMECLDSRG